MKNWIKKVVIIVVFFKIFTAIAQQDKEIELKSVLASDEIHETTLVANDTNLLSKEIAANVQFLASDDLKGRDTGSEGLDAAASFIEKTFIKYKVAPYFEAYQDTFEATGLRTQNVIGFIKGNDPELAKEFVIFGAHYDHIGVVKEGGDTIANGANDNAAGTAAVLALSKYFSEKGTNKRSLLFVLFGAEERGLLGSEDLSKKLKDQKVDLYTMINFEMIGVPLVEKSYKAYITGYEMSNLASKLNTYAEQELVGFLPKAKEFNLFKRSDNYPFYEQFGVPCQTVSTFDFTNYAYYHHVDDEVSQLDFVHMAHLINDFSKALEILVNAPKEIKLNNTTIGK